jgi:serine/threonine protein kinase
MSDPKRCPQCGDPLPPEVLQGLCPACLLWQGAASETSGRGTAPFAPPEIARLTELFPQLEIIELLGQGGMGAVYKARQPALERFVALKSLGSDGANETGFESRFTREARALARLSHPSIVGVHEFGEAGGLHYFIMEYVDGANLRQLQKAGRLSTRDALQIVPQICDALQYAHDEGVVHRDIKPENVLIDRKGRVKIADFGLAKILGVSPETARLTAEGHVMGTPHYMAPEQLEHPLEVDHRADIYSLGVVFYEMLTGELPLGKFAAPSRKVQIDVRLDEVVLRALEKEPELRYQHASEVRTGVESLSSPAPASPRVGEPAGVAAPTQTRLTLPRVVLGCVVGFVLLAVGSVVLFRALMAPDSRRNLAPSERQQATQTESRQVAQYQATPQPDGSLRGALPQGWIELVAVSAHPPDGKRWWRPDGRECTGELFKNEGLKVYPSEVQQAREFVFRLHGLPTDASQPSLAIDGPANLASGGAMNRQGESIPGYYLLSAALPGKARTVTARAGVALGPWETLHEHRGPNSGSASFRHNGVDWIVSFLNAVEKAGGGFVVSLTHTPTELETRVAAVDGEGKEHFTGHGQRNTFADSAHHTATFDELPLSKVTAFRLQTRPYTWVEFPNVALNPQQQSSSPSKAQP